MHKRTQTVVARTKQIFSKGNMFNWGIIVILLLSTWCITMLGFYTFKYVQIKNNASEIAFSAEELNFEEYEKTEGSYVSSSDFTHFYLYNLNQFVDTVTLDFEETLAVDINTKVYYILKDGQYFNESDVKFKNLKNHITDNWISINEEVVHMRIDVGSKEGAFSLESVTINSDKLNIYKNKANALQWIVRLGTLVIIACTLVLLKRKYPLERIFVVLGLLIGLGYCFAMTPYSIPDESHHYQRTYQMSNIITLNQLPLLEEHHNNYGFVGHSNVASGYVRVFYDLKEVFVSENTTTNIDSLQYYIPKYSLSVFLMEIARIPPAIGVTLARVLGLNFSYVFLLGRMTNLLFYIGFVYLALKRLPQFRTAIFIVALLPMSMHQAASFSSDAFINAIAFLLFSYLLCAIYESGLLKKKDYGIIFVCVLLLSTIKVIYALVAIMFILVKKDRFLSIKSYYVKHALLYGGCISMVVFTNIERFFRLAGSSQTDRGYYSVGYVFSYPGKTIEVFWKTIESQLGTYLRNSFGLTLSGLTLYLPEFIYTLLLAIVFLSCLSIQSNGWTANKRGRNVMMTIVMGVGVSAMMAMFLGWTPEGSNVIEGVQGRYFIPILPVLLFVVRNRTVILTKNIQSFLVVSMTLIQCYVLIKVVEYTIQH